MRLLTEELQDKIPALYSGNGAAVCKFFTPDSNWTWYVYEGCAVVDGNEVPLRGVDLDEAEDVMFFGLVDGFERELGYFSLNELQSIRGALGLPVERDLYFTPELERHAKAGKSC